MYQIQVAVRPGFSWDVVMSHSAGDEGPSAHCEMDNVNECKSEVILSRGFAGSEQMLLVGVFDGHGPDAQSAAVFASKFVSNNLERMLRSAATCISEERIIVSMKKVCEECQSAMASQGARFDALLSGTSACFGLFHGQKFYAANVGDSRCVLVSLKGTTPSIECKRLTTDSRLDKTEEMQRIVSSGGVVSQRKSPEGDLAGPLRVFEKNSDQFPGLSVSRSLGDLIASKLGVTHEPIISVHTLDPQDQYIVFGTGKLWDVFDDDNHVGLFVDAYTNRRGNISCAEAISFQAQKKLRAISSDSFVDDLSVVLVQLQPQSFIDKGQSLILPESLLAPTSNVEATRMVQESLKDYAAAIDNPSILDDLLTAEKNNSLNPKASKNIPDLHRSSLTDAIKDEKMERNPIYCSRQQSEDECPREGSIEIRQSFGSGTINSKTFIPSEAIGVPLPGTSQAPTMHQSAPLSCCLAEDELRPIRKAHPSYAQLTCTSPWDGLLSMKSQSEAWMLDTMESLTPRSSESNSSAQRGDDRPHRGELRHEGKVHRGIPCSYSSMGLASHGRLSTDSEASQNLSRMGSLDEYTLVTGFRGLDVASPSKARPMGYNRNQIAATMAMSLPAPDSRAFGSLKDDQQSNIKRSLSKVVVLRDINEL
jgi:serine/threonine protein phosphatase PrpC